MSRLLLMPFAILYGVATSLRNLFFSTGILPSAKYDIPVINIGNLSVGGTGKTPHVEYLVKLLMNEFKVTVLSRGYGRKTKGYLEVTEEATADEVGDEPLQYKTKFPRITVVVCEKRREGIDRIIREHHPDVILLDDSFQHRYVTPSLNILLTEYTSPFFRDYLLPAGRLRETTSGASRAGIIIITKCPSDITPADRSVFASCIIPSPGQTLYFSGLKYGALTPFGKHLLTEQVIYNQYTVLAVSGIADPSLMITYLQSQFKAVETLMYPDHYSFTTADLQRIAEKFDNIASENKIIITTEKDYMRLRRYDISHLPAYYLPVEVHFDRNDQHFDQYILDHVRKNQTNS